MLRKIIASVALAGILALIMAGWGALVATPPTLSAAAQAETSGSGAQSEVNSRFTPWRITPQEAQRRFATRR